MQLPLDGTLIFADSTGWATRLFGVWASPLWAIGAGVLIAVAAIAVVGFLLQMLLPKLTAVAWTTAKEALLQPLFWVVMVAGAAFLAFAPFIAYNTLGEDIKMLKDSGLTLLVVLAAVVTVWTASSSVSEEIEGRTAVTVLSKPISRLQFIFGKFVGLLAPGVIIFIVLGALFLTTVSFKVVYEARETASPEPTSQQCLAEVAATAPGLALGMMETIVLASIALAISTRLPMIPNLIICASIYALGHLLPTLVHQASQGDAIPFFMAQLFAAVLPMLEYLNMHTAIMRGTPVPLAYLGTCALYTLIYTSVAMLFALLLFEDRDLA